MFVEPSPDSLIDAVQVSLMNDILPQCTNEKAQVAVVMMQTVLQMARQLIPVVQQNMAEEHNAMVALFQDMAKVMADSPGPEAGRLRARAAEFGARPLFAPLPAYAEITAAHHDLNAALVDTMRDLDALIRGGDRAAEEALQRFRNTFGPRIARDFGTVVVGAGMAGRG